MDATPTDLVVFGPYLIPFEANGQGLSKHITPDSARRFWQQPEVQEIAGKQGCYVFVLKNGHGYTPWYVGKTTASFRKEALQPHKLGIFNSLIYSGQKGLPALFFVARPGRARKIPPNQVDNLETFLIQSAYYRNPDLANQKKAGGALLWGIRGVIRGGKGKAPHNASGFRKMLRL